MAPINLEDIEAVITENLACSDRNTTRESNWNNPDFIEEISDDEFFLDEHTL